MEDQATSLRRLVEGKNEYRPAPEAVPPVQAPAPQAPVQPAVPAQGAPLQQPAYAPPPPQQGYSTPAAQPAYRAASQTLGSGGARIIAVTSGKGGVGKTNFTVNLAISLGLQGKRVLIIDADLGMANVDVLIGASSKHNLVHLLDPAVTLEDVVLHGPYGVNYISGGSALERALEFSYEERAVLMEKLAACEQQADIILIDTGAGLGRNVMDFILAADEVLLLTTPEPTSLTDAYAVMKAYSLYATRKNMRLVVNRIFDETESRDVTRKLRRTSQRFLQMPMECLGYIFDDPNVVKAVRRQRPFVVSFPNTMAARCVQAIARNLLFGTNEQVSAGWRGFLHRLFNSAR